MSIYKPHPAIFLLMATHRTSCGKNPKEQVYFSFPLIAQLDFDLEHVGLDAVYLHRFEWLTHLSQCIPV